VLRSAARGLAAGLGIAAAAGCASFVAGLSPQGPPAGSESALRLAPGPYAVVRRDTTLVDASRPTPANGTFAGAPTRTLATTLWAPESVAGPLPLVVYSHGFLSLRHEAAPLAEHLASHGYAVASVEFPLSNWNAPGGPTLHDIASQPGDVRFLIDSLLAGAPGLPLPAPLDPERIAAIGLSLGGLTTTLVAFHPELRDPRVRAAISIAGPSVLFSPRFFSFAPVPLLMIAATNDAVIDYASNATRLLERAPHAALLTLAQGTHIGFSGITALWLQLWPNPDTFGCGQLERSLLAQDDGDNPFAALGGAEQGIVLTGWGRPPCAGEIASVAMRPVRQQRLLSLAVRAFLDSQLGATPRERREAWHYLAETLPREAPDASFASHGIAEPRIGASSRVNR
jgi:predicted dienelactone hydrolase